MRRDAVPARLLFAVPGDFAVVLPSLGLAAPPLGVMFPLSDAVLFGPPESWEGFEGEGFGEIASEALGGDFAVEVPAPLAP